MTTSVSWSEERQTDISKRSSTSVKTENNIRATNHRNIVYINPYPTNVENIVSS